MASSQQVLFAETVIAMKKAIKRKAYESDSDEEIDHHGNRGQKLKKRARFVHEGQLAPPSGPEVYREIVNHGGYERAIINRNPPLVDEEGYEPESDDEDYEERMQEIMASAFQFNPYASVRLETILAPLTSLTDLASHPTLARPYTSKTLTDLTTQACNIMHKENAALWKVKHLLTKLTGDHVWVPCELMIGPNDLDMYRNDYLANGMSKASASSESAQLMLERALGGASTNGQPSVDGETPSVNKDGMGSRNDESEADADTSMVDADGPLNPKTNGNQISSEDGDNAKRPSETDEDSRPPTGTSQHGEDGGSRPDSKMTDARGAPVTNGDSSNGNLLQKALLNGKDVSRMAESTTSTTSDGLDEMFIHPIFIAPRSAHPDRDLGIPEAEADDVRRLLQLWVQKQEEVCRGAKRLYEGLLRADRLRKTVFQWSKYEAHSGPNRDMSDGEDWYDKEEWGLDEDLKKGQDEEEEDTTQTTKKTRTRR
ncbi:hypothetical protein PG993_005316 [Apiospora rasikravindrae]|uniref:Transcriptional regulatory protein RXT2 N-terminal domain-containing protein n=1 Tax=Apiospora rasikravindrae TaxID=990691 RepID=A0ABR1TFW3_9PEZI